MYGIGCLIRNKWNTLSIILTSTCSQDIMCKSWNKITRKNWSDWVVKYLLQNIGIVETQSSMDKGFNFYMCACFVVCDFVSCHCVEHQFSLVAYDKLYTTQNNVWKTSINEGRLFVCFCLYLWDPLNQDASDRVLCLFGKLSRRRGCIGLVSWCLDLRHRSPWILNDFFTEN